jgi:hypothetical protein
VLHIKHFFYCTRDSDDNTANAIRQVSTNKPLNDTSGSFCPEGGGSSKKAPREASLWVFASAVRVMESIWVRVVELEEIFWPEDGKDTFDFDDISYSVLEYLKFSATGLVNVTMAWSRLAGPALNIPWFEQPIEFGTLHHMHVSTAMTHSII